MVLVLINPLKGIHLQRRPHRPLPQTHPVDEDVMQTFVRESSELVHIYVDNEEIVTTPTHPFYVPQKAGFRLLTYGQVIGYN